MRLVIDVDKQYKKLFMEAAKAAKAKVQIDEQYLTEAEEDKALLKLMEEGQKEGRMSEKEQADFKNWLMVNTVTFASAFIWKAIPLFYPEF